MQDHEQPEMQGTGRCWLPWLLQQQLLKAQPTTGPMLEQG